MAIRRGIIAVAAGILAIGASAANAQTTSGFVSGPLTWTPVIQLREAGVDSNVFNSPTNQQQDVTGNLGGFVDANLDLPRMRVAMHEASEYVYFERFKGERALNGNASFRVTVPLSYFEPAFYGSWTRAKDRTSDEFDVRARHHDHALGTALTMNIGQRFAVTGDANRTYVNYVSGSEFEGVDVGQQLNRQSSNVSSTLRVMLTPFTFLNVGGGFGLDEFKSRPSNNTENVRA